MEKKLMIYKKNNLFLRTAIIFLVFVSCGNNSQEIRKSIEVINTDAVFENHIALINKECNYYLKYSLEPAGKLEKGQNIVLGDYYYLSGFDIKVEVKSLDGTFIGYVYDQCITYPDSPSFWFKNTLFTREYYYVGTIDDIFLNDYGENLGQDIIERKRIIQLWQTFFSENRLYISGNYMVLGNEEDSTVYRIKSIAQDRNTYILHLTNLLKDECEVTLVDDGDGIIMTRCVNMNTNTTGNRNAVINSLNFKYVPFDIKKSKETENSVMKWCNQQLANTEDIEVTETIPPVNEKVTDTDPGLAHNSGDSGSQP